MTFFTNIPSPYNLDLFESLAQRFSLSVYYFTRIETERQWDLNIISENYTSCVLRKDVLFKLFQKINRNFYFNIQCIRVALTVKSEYFILGGNYFAPNTIFLLLILRLRSQTVFWYGERLLPSPNLLTFIIKRILITPVNVFTKAVFAIGEAAMASYIRYGYVKPIFNTPYAINNDRLLLANQRGYQQKEKIIFLSSGSLIDRKGYDLALGAFNSLDKDLKSRIEYWIIGDGPLALRLKSLIDPEVTVRFLGFVEPKHLAPYFASADIFILTSRYDGWGVVVNEAIAAGLPIIVTNTCGASEYVDAKGGFVVNCDVVDISSKIKYLLLNPELAGNFSIFNSKKANEISSDRIAEKMFNHMTSDT